MVCSTPIRLAPKGRTRVLRVLNEIPAGTSSSAPPGRDRSGAMRARGCAALHPWLLSLAPSGRAMERESGRRVIYDLRFTLGGADRLMLEHRATGCASKTHEKRALHRTHTDRNYKVRVSRSPVREHRVRLCLRYPTIRDPELALRARYRAHELNTIRITRRRVRDTRYAKCGTASSRCYRRVCAGTIQAQNLGVIEF